MTKIDRSKMGLRLIVLIATVIIALFLSSLLLNLFLLLSRGLSFGRLGSELGAQMSNPSFLLLMQGLQTLLVFILPPFLLSYWYGEKNSRFLKLVKAKPVDVLLAMFSILAAVPLVNFLVSWNQDIQFPSFLEGVEKWMRVAEDNAQRVTELMLQGESWSDLLWQLLVVAVMAGFGEELLFRGTLQSIISSKGRIQLAIWITAFVFSLIHMQFYGFIPRLLLGAWFGYLLLWSGSIWVPVAAHFANNAISVVFHYAEKNNYLASDPELLGVGENTWQLIPSILLLTACGLFFYLRYRKSTLKKQHV
ncbi:MAG TPA: type II CAAX endopeptidase family protein [Bacteroidales bacterium]|nr:type II CAAX endopeptidase family protein [Bacteroidales bacterium]HPL06367.1 type II CAAX endopeptidase family protein [Bacteroidales bacterium]